MDSIARPNTYTAGLLFLETHADNQFAKQPEGLRHFRDHHWKALGEENPDLFWVYFSVISFWSPIFLNSVKTWSR